MEKGIRYKWKEGRMCRVKCAFWVEVSDAKIGEEGFETFDFELSSVPFVGEIINELLHDGTCHRVTGVQRSIDRDGDEWFDVTCEFIVDANSQDKRDHVIMQNYILTHKFFTEVDERKKIRSK
jgi:hypothetical protein